MYFLGKNILLTNRVMPLENLCPLSKPRDILLLQMYIFNYIALPFLWMLRYLCYAGEYLLVALRGLNNLLATHK